MLFVHHLFATSWYIGWGSALAAMFRRVPRGWVVVLAALASWALFISFGIGVWRLLAWGELHF